MAVKPVAKTTGKGRRPKVRAAKRKPTVQRSATRGKGSEGLSRTALEFLAANSPTPEHFNEPDGRPPFEIQDK